MRLGEIRNLKWAQVSLREHTIRLNAGETKNDQARIVPLNKETVVALKMLKDGTGSIFVFGNGKPLGSFRKAWRTACVKSGLGKVTKREDGVEIYEGLIFHDLRRTGVRNLVRAGVPTQIAMAVSGHKTHSVFQRYNIVDETDLKDAVRKLDSYMIAKHNEIDQQKESSEAVFGENTVKKQAIN
jgi:integrase